MACIDDIICSVSQRSQTGSLQAHGGFNARNLLLEGVGAAAFLIALDNGCNVRLNEEDMVAAVMYTTEPFFCSVNDIL